VGGDRRLESGCRMRRCGVYKPPSFSLLLLFTLLGAFALIRGLTDTSNVLDVVVVVI
jgi:hypothetical protein